MKSVPHFDRVVASRPVNQLAALVASASPVQPTVGPTITCAHWDIPPVTYRPASNAPDLTGRRFGCFVVVGYLGKLRKSSPRGCWLVRCNCGLYESRTSRSINNPHNHQDMCVVCRKRDYHARNFSLEKRIDKLRQSPVLVRKGTP